MKVLSVEQTHHLEELGLRTDIYNSTLLWWKQKGEWKLYATESCEAHPSCDILIPAYTLQDVLDKLPKQIGLEYIYDLCILPESISYTQFIGGEINDTMYEIPTNGNLLDAAYEMLCWCIKEGHVTRN